MGQYCRFSAALTENDPPAASRRPAVDWPTVVVGLATFAAFGLLTWNYHALPWWSLPILGGYLICLHGSLQHEAVHGMPFRRRWLNAAFVFPSLWLWLPYNYYRELHLAHHRNEYLTSPVNDPESNYMNPAQYAGVSWLNRAVRQVMRTLGGRMIVGPAYYIFHAFHYLVDQIRARDWQHVRLWLIHVPAVAIVLVWVMLVCDIPLWEYLLLIAYPGISLTVMRSYLEHRAAADPDHRTAIVEAGPLFSLMFLNNNLHLLHHAYPAESWHQRAARYRAERDYWISRNNGYVYKGYREVIARYFFCAKEPMIHPLGDI